MPNAKQTKNESLAIIDAAITILDRYPEFNETNTNLSYDLSLNPFAYLMDCLKRVAGYDVFLKIIAAFLSTGLPALELSAKTLLLARMKNIQSCTLNPFITKGLLMNGIMLDLRQLDVMNMLFYSPFDNIGKCYYFGCDTFKATDELKDAGDFNAFLWFVKNRAMTREVWYGVNFLESNIDSLWYGTDPDLKTTVIQKKRPTNPPQPGTDKCSKSDGIITLRYCQRQSAARNAEGVGLSGDDLLKYMADMHHQIPHNDCLQVFLGNTQGINNNVTGLQEDIRNANVLIAGWKQQIEELKKENIQIEKEKKELKKKYSKQLVNLEEYNAQMEALSERYVGNLSSIADKEGGIEIKKDEKITKQQQLIDLLENGELQYRTVEQNYYYGHTIFEFLTDYVMSLKLFDTKTVLAQLIDALTGCLKIDLNLSYEQLLIKYETERMVKEINSTDENVIDDCFFTFSNKEYDDMLRKAELTREGLYGTNVENATGVKIDASEILKELNEISDTASQAGTVKIEQTLNHVSKLLSNTEYQTKDKGNFSAEMHFYENLMENLAYIITMSILSPKIYLVLAIQLKLLQQEPDFQLNDFIAKNRDMFVQLIRGFRDEMLSYFTTELMKLLEPLAKELGAKLSAEQMQYYSKLIKRLIECFKFARSSGNNLPWDMDNVDYADIYDNVELEPENKTC